MLELHKKCLSYFVITTFSLISVFLLSENELSMRTLNLPIWLYNIINFLLLN